MDDADSDAPDKITRRRFVQTTGIAVAGSALVGVETGQFALAATNTVSGSGTKVKLRVNGKENALELDPRMTLLDALRERLDLTGSKEGCDHGQCGACTVLVDGQRVLSCLSLAVMQDGKEITTIEGIAQGDALHAVQAAFIEHDAFQCGYCTSGQICSAIGMLREVAAGTASQVTPDVAAPPNIATLSDAEIRERMSGNLCRC
ncbi:MAG: 2Fe-2S iron-sulfur cluster-binding protein, partial [Verrucomicrobiota bacterium]|nr:2Fe-2S iron-sulfur cluster-binding protein [Verrucomicrobiota bacterium]